MSCFTFWYSSGISFSAKNLPVWLFIPQLQDAQEALEAFTLRSTVRLDIFAYVESDGLSYYLGAGRVSVQRSLEKITDAWLLCVLSTAGASSMR